MKVKITKIPQARTGYQVQGSLANDVPAMGGADYNTYTGKPKLKASKYMTAVPREEANLEAEGGETVYGDLNGDGMPEHKTIKGPRHSSGGVPLNLPNDTFIYSDFRGMNIKEPEFLQMFGKGNKGKKSYTPAELAKQCDIEKYRKILQDPDSDKIDIKTAELMIKNYQLKLAALALVQEAKKGLPQGIASVSKPIMAENQYTEDMFVDPAIKQFEGQIDGKIAQAEQVQNTEQQDPDFAQQAQQAEEMNEGQPVAQSQNMGQPMAQYGMSMGGYDFPYEENMPEAEYGMAMGVNSRNYMGRSKSPMYARGGALRTYQGNVGASSTGATGGAPAVDDGTLDVTGLDPEESNKKYQIWMKHNPGKEPKIMLNGKPARYVPPTKPTGDLSLSDLKSINTIGYKMLEKELTNPNSKVRAEIIKEGLAAFKDPRTGGKRDGKVFISDTRKNSKEPTGDQIINGLLSQKKRNDVIKESGMDMRYLTNDAEKFETFEKLQKRGVVTTQAEYDKIKKEYQDKGWDNKNKIAKTLKLTLPTPQETLIEQTGSHAIARVQNNKVKDVYKDWGDDDAYQLETLFGKGTHDIQTNTGGSDESEMAILYGDDYNTLSPMEGFAGNSTLAHGANPNTARGNFEAVPDEVKEKGTDPCPECTRADGTSFVPDRLADGTCPPCDEKGEVAVTPETQPKMWLQDKIKTAGAFTDLMSAKKYMPWAAKYDLRTPKPTFMDPTRELAANAEQANIQTNALAQFAGPQALSARSSGVMGQASKNAADVMSKYNNANVNIANQFESNIANIENQEQQLNTGAQQKLYDQNTITNQQYDNTKRALRNNLMNQTTSGITNMTKTAALNKLYPQWQVDPTSGGNVDYDPTKARQIKPEMSGDNEQAYYDECSKRYKDEATIQRCVDSKIKNTPSGGGNSAKDAFDAHNAKEGGFIYGDVTYPFIF